MKKFLLVLGMCFLITNVAMAALDSDPSNIRKLSSCVDNGDFLYIVELENGFTSYNYHTHATDENEAQHRKSNYSMLLSAYHAGKKVKLHNYNQGVMKCGFPNSGGELKTVDFDSTF